jgi:hypothetical protein
MKTIKTNNSELLIFVDDEDYDNLCQFTWTIYKDYNKFYAFHNIKVNGKQKNTKMHRLISKAKRGEIVDHIDGNGLNNQKLNLRICTHQENLRNRTKQSNNSSGYKGVTWHKGDKKWQAQALINKKMKYLGSFDTPEEAAIAYDRFIIENFGEFGITNYSRETYA